MAENEEPRKQQHLEEEDELSGRFPTMPNLNAIPDAPKLSVQLPPHPDRPKPGSIEPGGYNNLALAATAATSFIMPVLVLSVGGIYLDRALHHKTPWFAMAGVIFGMVVGISALMRVINKMSK